MGAYPWTTIITLYNRLQHYITITAWCPEECQPNTDFPLPQITIKESHKTYRFSSVGHWSPNPTPSKPQKTQPTKKDPQNSRGHWWAQWGIFFGGQGRWDWRGGVGGIWDVFVLFVFLNLQPTFTKTSQVRKSMCGRENSSSVSILQVAIKKKKPQTQTKTHFENTRLFNSLAEKQLSMISHH